jgi:hypothetical protein
LPRLELDARLRGVQNQGQPEEHGAPKPARGLRPVALLVSGVISAAGAMLVLFGMDGASPDRVAAGWALIQFLSGVWAGVLGANNPFYHGVVAGLPSLVLGLIVASAMPAQFVVMSWFIAPAAALVAAAIMRFMRRRG